MRHWVRRTGRTRLALALALGAAACTAATAARGGAPAPLAAQPAARTVRIALAQRLPQVQLSADGPWRLYAADGRAETALTEPRERWVLERDGTRISARREDSRPVSHRDTLLVARPTTEGGTITFNGRRWRGELRITVSAAGLLVVNHVGLDDYLQGVVPLEIGTRATGDVAAVEAQAIAARSYAVTHMAGRRRAWDMVATVNDQVYGGASAETRLGNAAVQATAGLVLLYAGRPVNAPYHAACGGSTAEAPDVWRTAGEPYLRRVSDQVPGTDRFYCDHAPRHRWTRAWTGDELRASVARYVQGLAGGGGVAQVRDVRVASVTPAGRVQTLAVETDRRTHLLRGNEMREALRSASGDLLYSTYFSAEVRHGRSGVERLTLRGGGNGHGIGMCQSGAIGRARAGHDVRAILRTYYPGTTVGRIDAAP